MTSSSIPTVTLNDDNTSPLGDELGGRGQNPLTTFASPSPLSNDRSAHRAPSSWVKPHGPASPACALNSRGPTAANSNANSG